MQSSIIPLYPTSLEKRRCAFMSGFGVESDSVSPCFQISHEADGKQTGCYVTRVTQCFHCTAPHLEVASHIAKGVFPTTVRDALSPGVVENALLITPLTEPLQSSGESYPVGHSEDSVISKRALVNEIKKHRDVVRDTVIIRLSDNTLNINQDGEILEWPYLTLEAAGYLHNNFMHIRTNIPSIERKVSDGGMWSHALFFGMDPARPFNNSQILQKRTVGELFHLPDELADGEHRLCCPYQELGLDSALTLPIVIS